MATIIRLASLGVAAALAGTTAADNFRTTTTLRPLPYPASGVWKLNANGDARDDIIVVYGSPCGYQLWLADEDGSLVPGPFQAFTAPQSPPSTVGDFDSDGFEDLAVVAVGTQGVRLFRNSGDGSMDETAWQNATFTNGISRLYSLDADGDGPLDLVVSNSFEQFILFGNGDGTFGSPAPVQDAIFLPTALVAADVLSAGSPQLLALQGDDLYIYTVENRVITRQSSILLPSPALAIGIEDVDRDGTLDVVLPIVSTPQAMVVSFHPSTGAPVIFAPPHQQPVSNFQRIAFGDVNDDGFMDIVPGSQGYGPAVIVPWTGGPPSFYEQTQPATGIFANLTIPLILDVDGDGRNEIAYCGNEFPAISVIKRDSFGTFQSAGAMLTLPSAVRTLIPWLDPTGTERLVVSTFNHGIQRIEAEPGLLFGFELESFGVPNTSSSLRTPLASGDINGDGLNDLVAVNLDNNISHFVWQLSQSDGSFGPALSRPAYTAGQTARGLAVADFNSDGYADAATLLDNGKAVVSLGRASGYLAPPYEVTLSDGGGARSLQTCDLDQDGNADLICALISAARIVVAYGRGDGTFEAAIRYETPFSAPSGDDNSITFGVLNADPYLDIVVLSSSRSIAYLSSGPRTYADPTIVSSGSGANHVTVIDFDADGRNEVSTTFIAHTEIAGPNAQGPFASKAQFNSLGGSSAYTAYRDINADGLPDCIQVRGDVAMVIPNQSTAPCTIDFYPDDRINLFDIAAFLDTFQDADLNADLDRNGILNFFDVARFIDLYLVGCP